MREPFDPGSDEPIQPDAAGPRPHDERPQDDPKRSALYRKLALRRAIYLALSVAAAAISVRAVAGKRGWIEAHRSRLELARLEVEVDKWRDRNASLEKRIKSLREDPAATEALARERLGWVIPGEITFLFPYDPSAHDPGDEGPIPPGEFAPTIGEDLEESASDDSSPPIKP